VEFDDIKIIGKDSKIILKKEHKNSSHISPSALMPYLEDYRDVIEAIELNVRILTLTMKMI
jgi:hypothetical protein